MFLKKKIFNSDHCSVPTSIVYPILIRSSTSYIMIYVEKKIDAGLLIRPLASSARLYNV